MFDRSAAAVLYVPCKPISVGHFVCMTNNNKLNQMFILYYGHVGLTACFLM